MKTVLVTGGKGQLASCIKDIGKDLMDFHFVYVDYDTLDITKEEEVKSFFDTHKIDYCINCAAYTAVDKAESAPEIATAVNEKGVQNLANCCTDHDSVLIHISTDFVFDGKQSVPYNENDETNPLGVYGLTKLKGEKMARAVKEHFILRTSWLYSEYGHNFLKTMLRLGKEKKRTKCCKRPDWFSHIRPRFGRNHPTNSHK